MTTFDLIADLFCAVIDKCLEWIDVLPEPLGLILLTLMLLMLALTLGLFVVGAVAVLMNAFAVGVAAL